MIREALKALWEYRLRAFLTLSILAFGITALVGILTSLEALRTFIARNMVGLGSQAFSISGGGGAGIQVRIRTSRGKVSIGGEGMPIRLWEADTFIQRFMQPGVLVSRHIGLSFAAQGLYEGRKTPARIRLFGVDQTYFRIQELRLREGRFFTHAEVLRGVPLILLGADVAEQLFPDRSPVGAWVQVGRRFYRVVGVLERRGSLLGFSLDWECFVPWTMIYREGRLPALSLYVGAPSVEAVPFVMEASRQTLRSVRRHKPTEPDSFSLLRGEQFADFVLEQLRTITLATIGISLITLFGAALSLTNIMLVIVKERTHEIGLRMAVGATRARIRQQFLTEAVVIAVFGGAGGIVLGLLIGNIVAFLIGTTFVMPWRWVLLAVGLSGAVGILAGYQPAREASQLNPVDALRYE